MLEVVDALLSSGQLNEANTVTVCNLIIRTVAQPMTSAECRKVFTKLTAWIVTSEPQSFRDKALQGFSSLAERSPSVFLETVDTSYVKNIFKNMKQTKPDGLVGLLFTIFSKLGRSKTHHHHHNTIFKIVRTHLILYISYHGGNPLFLQILDKLYKRFPGLLPASSYEVALLGNVVIHLHSLHLSNCKCESKLSRILCSIWDSLEDKTPCLQTLHSMFQVLTSTSYSCPPTCLLAILESLPSNLPCINLPFLVYQPTERLVLMMTRVFAGLEEREDPVLTATLLQLLQFLGAARGDMMSTLSKSCLPRIVQQVTTVTSPKIREQLTFIALHLLYGEQHSPATLLSVIDILPTVVTVLAQEKSWDTRDFVVEAVHYFSSLYPVVKEGNSDTEGLITDLLREELLSPDHGRKLQLASYAWAYPGNIKMDRIPGKIVGLVNLGNTCYMNSILQALFCCKMFTDLVLVAVTSRNTCQPVITSLKRVFMCLKLSRKGSVNPKQFFEASRPSWFHVGQQQDSSEFLTFLFQKLEEEHSVVIDNTNNNTNMLLEKCLGEHGDGDVSDKPEQGNEGHMVEFSPSLVQSVYGGTQVVVYQCLDCSTMSQVVTRLTTLDLPLSISEEEPRSSISVEDLIKDYLKAETLHGENQYQCDTCHRLRDAVKTTHMKILPRHLIITLLRFMFEISSSRKEKLLTRVEVPSTLYLSGSREGVVKYDLYCVIVHSGLSSEVGHYYTLVRDRQSGVWSRVSDQVVETVHECWDQDLHSMNDTPYMLFYQREEVALKN